MLTIVCCTDYLVVYEGTVRAPTPVTTNAGCGAQRKNRTTTGQLHCLLPKAAIRCLRNITSRVGARNRSRTARFLISRPDNLASRCCVERMDSVPPDFEGFDGGRLSHPRSPVRRIQQIGTTSTTCTIAYASHKKYVSQGGCPCGNAECMSSTPEAHIVRGRELGSVLDPLLGERLVSGFSKAVSWRAVYHAARVGIAWNTRNKPVAVWAVGATVRDFNALQCHL